MKPIKQWTFKGKVNGQTSLEKSVTIFLTHGQKFDPESLYPL